MEFIFFLAVIAAVVYAVIYSRRRRGGLEVVDPGIGTIRRLYFYGVSFVALMMAANGVVLILQFVLEGAFGPEAVSASRLRLAVGASLAIVGLPLWAVHWLIVQRYVRRLPVETASLLRKMHVYLVLGVGLAFVMATTTNSLRWVFGERSFSGYSLATIVIWSGVWAFYWRLERSEGQPSADTLGIRRLYLYIASLAALIMAALGLGRVIHIILAEGYDSLVSLPVLFHSGSGLWGSSMKSALAPGLVGSLAWVSHWLYFARRDFGSILRQVYLYIFVVLGGTLTVLVALGFIIHGVLTWLFDVPSEEAVAAHFRFLPGAVATLSLGAGLWGYHWMVAQKEAEVSADESEGARRFYSYIMSAIGLGTLVTAVGILAHMALVLLSESSSEVLAGKALWRDSLAMAINLGLLGGPLWWYYWRLVQRRVSLKGVEERAALARRIFLFAALGIGMLALLGSVSGLLFVFLRDVLGDGLSRDTFRDSRPILSTIVAAAIFLPYHWFVYRQDRQAEPETPTAAQPRRRKDVTVLAGRSAESFVRSLEAAIGHGVGVLAWADPDAGFPDLDEEQYQDIAQRVADAAGRNVLLVPEGESVKVLSYD